MSIQCFLGRSGYNSFTNMSKKFYIPLIESDHDVEAAAAQCLTTSGQVGGTVSTPSTTVLQYLGIYSHRAGC